MKHIKIKKRCLSSYILYFLFLKLNFIIRIFFRDKLKEQKRFIIFRTGNLGDIACCIPLFYKLKKKSPETEFYLLTSRGRKELPGASDFIKEQGYFKGIIEYYPKDKDSVKDMRKRIKSLKPDGLLYLPQDADSLLKHLKVFLWGKMIGIKNIYGGMINFIPLFKHRQNETLSFMNEMSRMMLFLDEKQDLNEKYYKISDEEIGKVKNLLKEYELKFKGFITIHPGAKRKANRWKEEKFIHLINYLKGKYKIVLTGAKDEIEMCNRINEKTGCIDLSGSLNIKEIIALLSFSKLLISNDTGPVHLAPLVNTPVIMIQSARDFENKWRAYGENVYVLRKNTRCSPCLKDECENPVCMDEINLNDIIEVINKII